MINDDNNNINNNNNNNNNKCVLPSVKVLFRKAL